MPLNPLSSHPPLCLLCVFVCSSIDGRGGCGLDMLTAAMELDIATLDAATEARLSATSARQRAAVNELVRVHESRIGSLEEKNEALVFENEALVVENETLIEENRVLKRGRELAGWERLDIDAEVYRDFSGNTRLARCATNCCLSSGVNLVSRFRTWVC